MPQPGSFDGSRGEEECGNGRVYSSRSHGSNQVSKRETSGVSARARHSFVSHERITQFPSCRTAGSRESSDVRATDVALTCINAQSVFCAHCSLSLTAFFAHRHVRPSDSVTKFKIEKWKNIIVDKARGAYAEFERPEGGRGRKGREYSIPAQSSEPRREGGKSGQSNSTIWTTILSTPPRNFPTSPHRVDGFNDDFAIFSGVDPYSNVSLLLDHILYDSSDLFSEFAGAPSSICAAWLEAGMY